MICRKTGTTRAVLLHEVGTKAETITIDVLPALHAITGYDKTCKICSKNATLETAETDRVQNWVAFGKNTN